MEQVLGVSDLGSSMTGIAADPYSLDRALQKPEPHAWLVPGVSGEDALQGPPEPPDIRERLVANADGGYSYQDTRFHAEIFADGSFVLHDPPHFDLTETAMRLVGEDPFSNPKQQFLSQSQDIRDQMRQQHRALKGQRALLDLHHHLAAVWGDTTRSSKQRRDTLFRLWDECAKSSIGRSARSIIESFIQKNLPQGSEQAYSQEEIRILNQQRNGPDLFGPYGQRQSELQQERE